jgi:hypothetical protein
LILTLTSGRLWVLEVKSTSLDNCQMPHRGMFLDVGGCSKALSIWVRRHGKSPLFLDVGFLGHFSPGCLVLNLMVVNGVNTLD